MEARTLAVWIKDSLLFRDWMAIRGEIERHKWLVSEKLGYDVGWDWAYTDWMARHYRDYRRGKRWQDNADPQQPGAGL